MRRAGRLPGIMTFSPAIVMTAVMGVTQTPLSHAVCARAAQPRTPAALHWSPPARYTGVAFATPSLGWLVGGNQILRTDDGGWHFVFQYRGTLEWQGVAALNATRVVAWGPDGAVATKDGGKSWSALHIPGVGKSRGRLSQLRFLTPGTGFASTSLHDVFQALYRTTDGGAHWLRVQVPQDTLAAGFANLADGWAVVSAWPAGNGNARKQSAADGFYRTTDAGRHWIKTQDEPAADWMTTGATIYPVGTNDAYAQVLGGVGMSQSSSTLFHTQDGATWTPVLATSTAGGGPAPGVSGRKVMTGPGYDAGPVAVIGPRDVRVIGGMEATGYGAVAVALTNDGGVTWRTVSRIPGAAGIPPGASALSFVNPNDGWLLDGFVGPSQTLLRTTDGGAKWRVYHLHVAADQKN